ncbi:MAG TPA: hypothetical protein VFB50_17370 [Chloroflexota bacterium]|nr:hypothetical protein [Chloroflexota bacterium]
MFDETGRIPHVRSVPATLVAFLLLLLLAVTTPTGTGDGIHDSVLLHPLFSHSHLVGGRIISHEQMADVTPVEGVSKGPSLGAGAGASATAADALAISPTLPWQDLLLEPPLSAGFTIVSLSAPQGVSFAPPDPPPTSLSVT